MGSFTPEREIPSTKERTDFSRRASIVVWYRKEAKEIISYSKAEIVSLTSTSGLSIGGGVVFIVGILVGGGIQTAKEGRGGCSRFPKGGEGGRKLFRSGPRFGPRQIGLYRIVFSGESNPPKRAELCPRGSSNPKEGPKGLPRELSPRGKQRESSKFLRLVVVVVAFSFYQIAFIPICRNR